MVGRRDSSSGVTPLVSYALYERREAEFRLRLTHRSGIGTALSGCRGFKGPVPPPLWMSASCRRMEAHSARAGQCFVSALYATV